MQELKYFKSKFNQSKMVLFLQNDFPEDSVFDFMKEKSSSSIDLCANNS